MVETHAQWVRDMVQRILYVTIASVGADGKPWNSPVYSAYDDQGNFYWTSSPDARHSRNIEHNPDVALVIYDSTVPEGTGVGGVYLQAQATVLDDTDEIAFARRMSGLRCGTYDAGERPDRYLPGGVRRVYRARPTRLWVNIEVYDDQGNWAHDGRAEVPLSALTGLVTW